MSSIQTVTNQRAPKFVNGQKKTEVKKDFRNLIPVTGDVDTQLSFLPPEKVSYTYLTRPSNHNLENQVIENKLKYNDFY